MRVHLILLLAAAAGAAGPAAVRPPAVIPNDNRIPAGTLSGDTLVLELVLDLATWYPEGPSGPSVVVPALAEAGEAPRIPAPLIRVREGTIVRASIRNALDSAMQVVGLHRRAEGAVDTLALAASARRTVLFEAGAAGTYLYGAVPAGYTPSMSAESRHGEREQAYGGFIVDPADGSPPDRVLVINIWGEPDSGRYRNALAINGLSWPHTERFEAETGDTVHWRIINASARAHPMHMHGYYFTVLSRGTIASDRAFPPAQRRLMVTEQMGRYTTMAMSWAALRPGNWLFHCHLSYHVVPSTRLDAPKPADHARMSHRAEDHMAGLVVGIRVRPAPGYVDADRGSPPRYHVFAQEGRRRGRAPRAMGYVLQRGSEPPASDSLEIPGSVLVFERDRPADVVVTNRLREPVAIHWHGLELESWSDGVAGWSGMDSIVAPAVAPGDSFVARLTVPRAGTFIYHTHMNDIEQVTSGLYGAIVVLEPGARFDPATDHVFVIGWDGEAEKGPPQILINGDSTPAPLAVAAGIPHRLRFVNISPAGAQIVELRRDTALVEWRRLALDGADLPAAQGTIAPARHRIAVGQTADFEVRLAPGAYALTWALAPGLPPVKQLVVVR